MPTIPKDLVSALRRAFPVLRPSLKTTMAEVYRQAGIEEVLQVLETHYARQNGDDPHVSTKQQLSTAARAGSGSARRSGTRRSTGGERDGPAS